MVDKQVDKIKGAFLGFAIGDALGAHNEFTTNYTPISGYKPSPRKGLQAGQYTDDTQHLILGADSLLAYDGRLNLDDISDRLISWYNSGEARSMGHTTRTTINNLQSGESPLRSGVNHPKACGSLGLARFIPFSLLSALRSYRHKLSRGDIKRILGVTHAHKDVYHMGDLVNYFIQEITHGKSPLNTAKMILSENEFLNKRIRGRLDDAVSLSEGSIPQNEAIDHLGNGGFVEDVVFSSLFSAFRGKDFRASVLCAANGGGDSDSRAALTGLFCGLDSGLSSIPEGLVSGLEGSVDLESKANSLYLLSTNQK
ncbi:hypothetical protein COU61_04380 [Candidatus Pacearchaeota archaeon CG10_big_fil_rev_8_21_14_0_10_35_13]|nr:MAG: hypothetical protein COU61_04380 [Candidatus Pacearchaeota archaeon CG10_big_fil_rev_8_21_14_0_10_35_13]